MMGPAFLCGAEPGRRYLSRPMTDMSEAEKAAQVVARVSWVVLTLADALGVKCDPEQVRRHAREAMGARVDLTVEEEQALVREVGRAAGLTVTPGERGAVPLSGPDFVVLAQRADQVLVRREAGERWEPEAVACAGSGPWLTATASAPLATLGDESGHHATPLQRLRALVQLERDDLWVIVVYAAGVGLLTLATPIAVQTLVTSVAFGTLLQPIAVIAVLLTVALTFQATLKALQVRVVEVVQERLFVRTAIDLAWRLPRVRRDEAHDFGPETVNRFFDVVTAQKTAATLLTDGTATFLQIGFGMLVLAFYHPALLAFAIVLLGVLTALTVLPARLGLASSIAESRAKYEVAGWLQELARMPTAFRGAGAVFASERADALTRRYLSARRTHFRVLFGQTVGVLVLQVVASASLLGLGGWLV